MLYRQSIILFGFILPLLACALVVGGAYMVVDHMTASFNRKKAQYKTYEISRMATLNLEKQVGDKAPHMERWTALIGKETANAVTSNLREITDSLPGKEFQQTAFEPSKQPSGLGAASAQPSSKVSLSFRGTFRSAQRAFLELETRMPQLQLQELKIDPGPNSYSSLNFTVTYSAWEK